MRLRQAPTAPPLAKINVTPIIDVALVLVIILLVTGADDVAVGPAGRPAGRARARHRAPRLHQPDDDGRRPAGAGRPAARPGWTRWRRACASAWPRAATGTAWSSCAPTPRCRTRRCAACWTPRARAAPVTSASPPARSRGCGHDAPGRCTTNSGRCATRYHRALAVSVGAARAAGPGADAGARGEARPCRASSR